MNHNQKRYSTEWYATFLVAYHKMRYIYSTIQAWAMPDSFPLVGSYTLLAYEYSLLPSLWVLGMPRGGCIWRVLPDKPMSVLQGLHHTNWIVKKRLRLHLCQFLPFATQCQFYEFYILSPLLVQHYVLFRYFSRIEWSPTRKKLLKKAEFSFFWFIFPLYYTLGPSFCYKTTQEPERHTLYGSDPALNNCLSKFLAAASVPQRRIKFSF